MPLNAQQLSQIDELEFWYKHPEHGRLIGRMMRTHGCKNVTEFVVEAPAAANLALDTVSEFELMSDEQAGLQFSLQRPGGDDA